MTRLAGNWVWLVSALSLAACGSGGESLTGDIPGVDVMPDAGDGGGDDARPDVDPGDDSDVNPDVATDGDAIVGYCGPFPGGACADGQVCDIRNCLDGASGTCVPQPGACPEMYAPVCGCNGVTYDNDCFRLVAGEALNHAGECGTVTTCRNGMGPPCPFGQVCDVRSCLDGASGTCVPRPDFCSGIYDPVCGCDGVTYGNDCERLRAGAEFDHAGECGTVSTCGGSGGIPCPFGQVCNIHGCFPGAGGTCVPAPPAVCPRLWAPECGCDGRTYANECLRLRAGAALDHVGECAATDCVPECRTVGGMGAAWFDPCVEPGLICRADCTGCTASCEAVGTRSEGWYATCSDPGRTGGCSDSGGGSTRLIRWDDCG